MVKGWKTSKIKNFIVLDNWGTAFNYHCRAFAKQLFYIRNCKSSFLSVTQTH